MLKWHADTIEQSAFIDRLNRDEGVPTGVLRCLKCSSMKIYREREETVRGYEQRLELIKRNRIHVKSTKERPATAQATLFMSLKHTHTNTHAHAQAHRSTHDVCSMAPVVATGTRSVLVRVRHPRQVAVGAVILVGAVCGAAVVLGVGRRRRRAVVLV